MSMFLRTILILIFSTLLLGTGACYSSDLREDAVVSFIDSKGKESAKYKVQIAKTGNERNKGLMYRRNMPDNHGMFFIFDGMEERSFWMKNTYITLDMIFIDNNGVIKHIVHNVPPLTKTSRKSKYPCKYVLELKGGMSRKSGIEVGNKLKIVPKDII